VGQYLKSVGLEKMIDNLASKWSKEETELLRDNLESKNYEKLCDLFPGRTVAGIKAKQKRLLKEDPIPSSLVRGIFKYHLLGESDGQIFKRLVEAGHSKYTLKDIAVAAKKARQEAETIYAEEHSKKPTLDQLRNFIEKRING
jgi:hypothetical protein